MSTVATLAHDTSGFSFYRVEATRVAKQIAKVLESMERARIFDLDSVDSLQSFLNLELCNAGELLETRMRLVARERLSDFVVVHDLNHQNLIAEKAHGIVSGVKRTLILSFNTNSIPQLKEAFLYGVEFLTKGNLGRSKEVRTTGNVLSIALNADILTGKKILENLLIIEKRMAAYLNLLGQVARMYLGEIDALEHAELDSDCTASEMHIPPPVAWERYFPTLITKYKTVDNRQNTKPLKAGLSWHTASNRVVLSPSVLSSGLLRVICSKLLKTDEYLYYCLKNPQSQDYEFNLDISSTTKECVIALLTDYLMYELAKILTDKTYWSKLVGREDAASLFPV